MSTDHHLVLIWSGTAGICTSTTVQLTLASELNEPVLRVVRSVSGDPLPRLLKHRLQEPSFK